jgi:hypothetical protein
MIHRASFTGALWNSAGWVISQLRLKIEFSDGNVNAWASHGHGLWISTNIIVFIVFVSFTILYPSLLDSCQGLRPHTQVGFCETQVTQGRYARFQTKMSWNLDESKPMPMLLWGDEHPFSSYTLSTSPLPNPQNMSVTSTIGQIIINRWSLNIMNTHKINTHQQILRINNLILSIWHNIS